MNDKIRELLENAEKVDGISKIKWRIENREQLRKERKEKLKELMEKDKQQTALKLYTEEQLLNTAEAIRDYIKNYPEKFHESMIKKHLTALTPIELMTYDELMYIIEPLLNTTDEFDKGFRNGVQWLREKIQGGEQ